MNIKILKKIIFIFTIALFCFGFYYLLEKKKMEILVLNKKVKLLEVKMQQKLDEKKEMEAKINSQSDPEWIELVLMKKMGVVPEGKVKVQFSKEEEK